VEAEVVSTSPSVHDGSWGGKEVRKEHEQPKGEMRKGANPDNFLQFVGVHSRCCSKQIDVPTVHLLGICWEYVVNMC
jgi:hypothetical protein